MNSKPYIYILANQAQPAIRKVFAKGGQATVKVAGQWRCLQHMPSCDRPRARLPWLLSKLQPFWFRLYTSPVKSGSGINGFEIPPFQDTEPETTIIEYNHLQVVEAMNTFLKGCASEDEVSILYDPTL